MEIRRWAFADNREASKLTMIMRAGGKHGAGHQLHKTKKITGKHSTPTQREAQNKGIKTKCRWVDGRVEH